MNFLENLIFLDQTFIKKKLVSTKKKKKTKI